MLKYTERAKKALGLANRLAKSMHCNYVGTEHILAGLLKEGQGVSINVKSFPRPAIFDFIKETGNIEEKEMYNVFNMGIGFILAVEDEDVKDVLAKLAEINETAYVIGKVTNSGEVDLKW